MPSKAVERLLDNDPRDEHNHAPRSIRVVTSPKLREEASKIREIADSVDNIRFRRPVRGRNDMAFPPKGTPVYYDDRQNFADTPQAERPTGASTTAVPEDPPLPKRNARDEAIAELQEENAQMRAELVKMQEKFEAERLAREKSGSKKVKAKAKPDPDSMVSPNAKGE